MKYVFAVIMGLNLLWMDAALAAGTVLQEKQEVLQESSRAKERAPKEEPKLPKPEDGGTFEIAPNLPGD